MHIRLLLAILTLGGCTPPPATLPPPVDSAGEDGEDSAPETGDVEVVEGTVCRDPSLRETLGPFERTEIPAVVLQDFPEGPDLTMASGVGVGDIDGDGRLDLVVPQAGPPQLLLQQADGSFVDASAERWGSDVGASVAQVLDFNGDALPDVFLCAGPVPHTEPVPIYNRLYLNDGSGRLVEATEAWGLPTADTRACYGVTLGDIDGDDDLDMALAMNEACPFDFETGQQDCELLLTRASPQLLWENTGDRLVDISDRLDRQELLSSFTHVVTLLDVDGDHDLDLYLVNDDKIEVSFSSTNRLFTNDGAGGFTAAGQLAGLDISIAGMGIGVGDLNADALPDLFMSGTSRLYLMLSEAEYHGWYEASQAAGIDISDNPARIEGWGAELVDLDNDGDLDVPVVYGYLSGDVREEGLYQQPDALFLNRGDQTFTQVAEAWDVADTGIGRGLVVVDLDGDGWLDLLKRELGGHLRYHRARCGAAAWSRVDLRQPGANPLAIGAVIELTAEDGAVWRRWVQAGGTSLASNGPPTQHFGLGPRTRIARIVVTWPDGEQSTYTDLPVNATLTLSR